MSADSMQALAHANLSEAEFNRLVTLFPVVGPLGIGAMREQAWLMVRNTPAAGRKWLEDEGLTDAQLDRETE